MAVSWRSSAEELARILRTRGVDPAAVTSTAAAWRAFREFTQARIGGLDHGPDSDGFIVQWGRYRWDDHQLSISFTRQLAVPAADHGRPGRQPDLWQVSLTIVFGDDPALDCLETGRDSGTGFRFEPRGPERGAALDDAEARDQVQAALAARPVHSYLRLEPCD